MFLPFVAPLKIAETKNKSAAKDNIFFKIFTTHADPAQPCRKLNDRKWCRFQFSIRESLGKWQKLVDYPSWSFIHMLPKISRRLSPFLCFPKTEPNPWPFPIHRREKQFEHFGVFISVALFIPSFSVCAPKFRVYLHNPVPNPITSRVFFHRLAILTFLPKTIRKRQQFHFVSSSKI